MTIFTLVRQPRASTMTDDRQAQSDQDASDGSFNRSSHCVRQKNVVCPCFSRLQLIFSYISNRVKSSVVRPLFLC